MPQLSIGQKPSNAGYRGKITATADGSVTVVPDPHYSSFPHPLDVVEVAWYDDRVKVTFKKAGPACITQAFMTGNAEPVIIELRPL
jgi:hypothetical protein